jgi:hypothetical protein
MVAKAKCDSCGDSAVIHVTEMTSGGASTSHFCNRDGEVLKQELRRVVRIVWGNPKSREAAIQFFADETGLTRGGVLRQLEDVLSNL